MSLRVTSCGLRSAIALAFAVSTLVFTSAPTQAVVVYGEPLDLAGTPSLYTTRPADDPGWDRVMNGLYGGTAIYLGNNWVLTAGHVFADQFAFSKDNPWDPNTPKYDVVANYGFVDPIDFQPYVDLKLARISGAPNMTPLPLATTAPLASNSRTNTPFLTVLGTGKSRSSEYKVSLQSGASGFDYNWSPNPITWSKLYVSNPENRTDQGRLIVTTFRAVEGYGVGQGGDSGSGVFSKVNNTWTLAGVMVASYTQTGFATPGLDTNGITSIYRYQPQISALISRPNSFAPAGQTDLAKEAATQKVTTAQYGNSYGSYATDNNPTTWYTSGYQNRMRVLFISPRITNYTGYEFEDGYGNPTATFQWEVGTAPRVTTTNTSVATLTPQIGTLSGLGGMALFRVTGFNGTSYPSINEITAWGNRDFLSGGYLLANPAIIDSAPADQFHQPSNVFNRILGDGNDYTSTGSQYAYLTFDFGNVPIGLGFVEWVGRDSARADAYRLTFSNDPAFASPDQYVMNFSTATHGDLYSVSLAQIGIGYRYLKMEVTAGNIYAGFDEVAFYSSFFPAVPEPAGSALAASFIALSALRRHR